MQKEVLAIARRSIEEISPIQAEKLSAIEIIRRGDHVLKLANILNAKYPAIFKFVLHEDFQLACLFHNIGELSLINNPEWLNKSHSEKLKDRKFISDHTVKGRQILEELEKKLEIKFPELVYQAAKDHHKYPDKYGYLGKKKEEIPSEIQLITLLDEFCEMFEDGTLKNNRIYLREYLVVALEQMREKFSEYNSLFFACLQSVIENNFHTQDPLLAILFGRYTKDS